MEIINLDNGQFEMVVSKTELAILSNSLNEVCNGISIPEFEIRLGATLEDVLSILEKLVEAFDRSAPGS